MTAQAHENLILNGEKVTMAFCPQIPLNHQRIIKLKKEDVKKLRFIIFSTGCWRNYIGTWEIKNGRFYLIDIEGIYKIEGKEPIFADWFTGILRIPQGEMLKYVHMGFGSVFEEELHIKIENGIVTKSRIIDNRNKNFDNRDLAWENLPGLENRFDGDDEI